MQIQSLKLFLLCSSVAAGQTHGQDAEGKIMEPVAFLWLNRPWDAKDDKTAPCGSASDPVNRTSFPLTQGSVALSIADDAWQVAFRLTISNKFDDQVVNNITEVDSDHQCYRLQRLENIAPFTNATIQMKYWAEYENENNGKNDSFFACVDITFVEAKDFNIQVSCFNMTSNNFTAPMQSSLPAAKSKKGGLSGGAKAGVIVRTLVTGLALLGLVGFSF